MFEIQNKIVINDTEKIERTKERISKIEKKLKDIGAQDIRIYWNHEGITKNNLTLEKISDEICSSLERYLDSKLVEESFSD